MKIIEAKFNEDVLMLAAQFDHLLENNVNIALFVDECSNIHNISSTNETDHDYVFTQENSAINFILRENVNNSYIYVIYIEQETIEYLDQHLKHLTLIVEDKNTSFVYYNRETIYKAQINKLRCLCSTCLDDHLMQKIMIITFKQQLLEQSINAEHYVDSVKHYLDLCRMLNIQIIKYNNSCIHDEIDHVICDECINNICKLN